MQRASATPSTGAHHGGERLMWLSTQGVFYAGLLGAATQRTLGGHGVYVAPQGSSAAYTDLIHKLGGKPMDGIYATMTVQNPYTDEQSQPLRFWANKYKTAFKEDPTVFSVYGYTIIDAFIKVMDTMSFEPDMFGAPKSSYSATKRLGNDQSRLSQIKNGKWVVVSDYATTP